MLASDHATPDLARLPCNIVLSGGGVRGIAHAGALSLLETRYQPVYVAGTSAGSIVGALYAAGYTAAELRAEMTEQNFADFLIKTPIEYLPAIGNVLHALFHFGVYQTHRLHDYIERLLAAKNVRVFGDLKIQPGSPEYQALPPDIQAQIDQGNPRYCYRLHIIAADLTDNCMLVLPDDIHTAFGEEPDTFPVALAAQMSASIPGFFVPTRHPQHPNDKQHIIVDGGVLSGYPLFLFDETPATPPWPTFGLHLVDGDPDPTRVLPEIQFHAIHSPIDFALNLFQTLLNGHDNQYIETADFARSIMIPCATKAENFDLTLDEKAALYQSGHDAAIDFFGANWEKWDFTHYQQAFGAHTVQRRDLVVAQMGLASADTEAIAAPLAEADATVNANARDAADEAIPADTMIDEGANTAISDAANELPADQMEAEAAPEVTPSAEADAALPTEAESVPEPAPVAAPITSSSDETHEQAGG